MAIERFLETTEAAAAVEIGDPPILITGDNYVLAYRSGYLTFEVWNTERNLSRKITGIQSETRSRLDLTVERFGKRSGTLSLIDTARAQELTRRVSRHAYREMFRRSLSRQFATWRLAELTTEADLEHSLSPSYPRALIRCGSRAWAAIGAGPDSAVDGVVTFGLIWLDYLRARERRLTVEGLALFLPAGAERTTCSRLRWMNPEAAQFAAFVTTEDGYEDRLDLADYGNVETRLEHCTRAMPSASQSVEELAAEIARTAGVERIPRPDGSASLRVRGLEFARIKANVLEYGLETTRKATASNIGEIVGLARHIAGFRSPEAGGRQNVLYTRNPEGWLESQVRAHIQDIDATLEPATVYGQVPAFTAGDRDLIDLLATDHTGRLAVLELKASEDIQLPMQALDYWMRVRWHASQGEFAAQGYFPGRELRRCAPRLLLVAPALDFHPSNEPVLRYFSPEVEVERIGVGLEWRSELQVMFRYRTRG